MAKEHSVYELNRIQQYIMQMVHRSSCLEDYL